MTIETASVATTTRTKTSLLVRGRRRWFDRRYRAKLIEFCPEIPLSRKRRTKIPSTVRPSLNGSGSHETQGIKVQVLYGSPVSRLTTHQSDFATVPAGFMESPKYAP
jgi:hypothetical protein